MNYFLFLILITVLITKCNSYYKNFDEIFEINNKIWNKNDLTWTYLNLPTNLKSDKNLIYYEFSRAFLAWEKISHFTFDYLYNDTSADIKISFISPKHKLFKEDNSFSNETLAHAFFPENGHIHINDNINWGLSFFPDSENINLFYVILHEIGHSLGLNHVMNPKSIMFPTYNNFISFRNLNAFNFTFDPIDSKLLKKMYSNNLPSTTEKTLNITETSVINNTSEKPNTDRKHEDYYPDFTLCKYKEKTDWCYDKLVFNLIYDIEGYLFLYKEIDFWMYTDIEGIKSRKFNHFDYWNNDWIGLIQIIKSNNNFISFYKTYAQINSCNKNKEKLDYKKINITNSIDGIYYNHTSNILYLFSKETPKTYYKVINATKNAKTLVKPISLWKMNTFNYDIVFSRNNTVYFVNSNIVSYFDFKLDILVENIEFKDLFLRKQCSVLPLIH